MNVKATTAGFVMAGLVSAGAVTVLVVSQPAPTKQVQFVAPVVSTPTATVAPVVTTTVAPAPVESTTTAAPVVAPTSEAPVAVQPAPVKAAPAPAPTYAQTNGNDPAFVGRYYDGTPVKKRADGTVIPMPLPS